MVLLLAARFNLVASVRSPPTFGGESWIVANADRPDSMGDKWALGDNNDALRPVDREPGEPISTEVVYPGKWEAVLRPRVILIQPRSVSTPETSKRIEEITDNE